MGGRGGMKAMTMAPSRNAPTTQGQSVRTFGRCEILVIGISPRVHELSIAEPFLVYGGPTWQVCCMLWRHVHGKKARKLIR